MKEALARAEHKARLRNLEIANGGVSYEQQDYLSKVNKLAGEIGAPELRIIQVKNPKSRIKFSQNLITNLLYLVGKDYLTNAEWAFLFKLALLTGFGSNAVVKTVNKVQIGLSQREIAKMIKVSERTVNGLVNSLIKKGVLGRTNGSNGVLCHQTLYINPNLIYNGDKNNINSNLKDIFKQDESDKLTNFLPVNLLK